MQAKKVPVPKWGVIWLEHGQYAHIVVENIIITSSLPIVHRTVVPPMYEQPYVPPQLKWAPLQYTKLQQAEQENIIAHDMIQQQLKEHVVLPGTTIELRYGLVVVIVIVVMGILLVVWRSPVGRRLCRRRRERYPVRRYRHSSDNFEMEEIRPDTRTGQPIMQGTNEGDQNRLNQTIDYLLGLTRGLYNRFAPTPGQPTEYRTPYTDRDRRNRNAPSHPEDRLAPTSQLRPEIEYHAIPPNQPIYARPEIRPPSTRLEIPKYRGSKTLTTQATIERQSERESEPGPSGRMQTVDLTTPPETRPSSRASEPAKIPKETYFWNTMITRSKKARSLRNSPPFLEKTPQETATSKEPSQRLPTTKESEPEGVQFPEDNEDSTSSDEGPLHRHACTVQRQPVTEKTIKDREIKSEKPIENSDKPNKPIPAPKAEKRVTKTSLPPMLILVTILGSHLSALFDTGANISLISKSHAERLKLEILPVNKVEGTTSASGHDIHIYGQVIVDVKLSNAPKQVIQKHTLLVVDQPPCSGVLLGTDFMGLLADEYTLDFKRDQIKIKDHSGDQFVVPLIHPLRRKEIAYSVTAIQTVAIPPHSRQILNAMLESPTEIPMEGDFEPNPKKFVGLHSPLTIHPARVMMKTRLIPVAVENPTDDILTIYANESLGAVTPARFKGPSAFKDKKLFYVSNVDGKMLRFHTEPKLRKKTHVNAVRQQASPQTLEDLPECFHKMPIEKENLTEEEYKRLIQLIDKNQAVFSTHPYDIGVSCSRVNS